MMQDEDGTTDGMAYVTIREATAQTGVPGRTIRSWVARGKIAALPSNRGKMVSTVDVAKMALYAGVGNGHATGTQMAQEGHNDAMARATDDAMVARPRQSDGAAIVARLDDLYRDLLAEKDARIGELQRRAEVAEAEVATLRQDRATVPFHADMEPVSTPPVSTPARPWWRFW